jgi:PAS domain S-box-containing protein
VTERRLRGTVLALSVVAALVAVDATAGDEVQISGAYMLGAFVAAILVDVRTTIVVALLALVLSALSPLWDHNFGDLDWVVKLGIVIFGDLFAIETARARTRAARSLVQQETLAAMAELPAPGATLQQTIDHVAELLVPRLGSFVAVDAVRAGELARVGSAGPEPAADADRVTVPLRARGREIGALTVAGRRYDRQARDFLAVLAGRVALALDNAGLSEELHTAEQRMQAILANLAEAVTVQDRSGRLVYANEAAADLLGAASVEELLTTDPLHLVARFETFNEDGTPLRVDQLPGRHVLAGEEAEPLVVRTIDRESGMERWRVTKATPIPRPDGEVALAVNVIEDITDSKRTEIGQRLLADASAALGASLDYEDTLRRIADLAVPRLADWCSVALPRGDRLAIVASGTWPGDVDLPEVAAEVLDSGASILFADVDEALRAADVRSLIVVPIGTAQRALGVMVLVTSESRRRLGEADLELAQELGRRAGSALENARLHTELAEVAQTLQNSLLPPQLPDVPGWSLRSLYMPAAGHTEVGGDFYDVFPTAAGWMAVIGDVAGRGPAAASLTAMARYTLRTAASLVGTPTMGLVRLNENLREQGEMALCTVAIVLLREDAEASLVCAGHPLPVLIRDGKAQRVGRNGLLLGAFDHGHWLPAAVGLERGDVLVLFTDGVIDARSASGDGRFGDARLLETLEGTRDADEAVIRIGRALESFSGGEHSDDTAVLALMRN